MGRSKEKEVGMVKTPLAQELLVEGYMTSELVTIKDIDGNQFVGGGFLTALEGDQTFPPKMLSMKQLQGIVNNIKEIENEQVS